jgi:hypothetical protein
MSSRDRFSCDHLKACNILYAVRVLKWTQTRAAIFFELNGGYVSKIVRGERFTTAFPLPFEH